MNRATAGRIGGLTRASKPDYDGQAATLPARQGLMQRFLREVDPDEQLPPGERQRKADRLMEIHMIKMREARKGARK
jgi:hypothetical protein